jgi:hypothetical protein
MDGMTHKYIGTKLVLAVAMVLGDYNKYRGWTPPAGEDQTTEGYLVEYTDGGKPNHEDHKGYISWSPKDVFERSYRPVDTAKQRVELEFMELSDRLTKLEAFVNTPAFSQLDVKQRQLLNEQRLYMRDYRGVLNTRLNNWQEI